MTSEDAPRKTWAEMIADYEKRDAVHQVGVTFLPDNMAKVSCSCGRADIIVHEDKYEAAAYLHLGFVPENTDHLTPEWFRSPVAVASQAKDDG